MKKLPQGWRLSPLIDIASFASGGTPNRENAAYWNGDVPWFSAKDLKSSLLDRSIETITEEGAKNGSRIVPAGTILVLVRGMMLLRDFPIGITSRPAAFNQDVKALFVKEGFEAEFVAHALSASKSALLSMVDKAGHGTGRLITDRLEAFDIPIPPAPERRKITKILNNWEIALRTLERLVEVKDRHRLALMERLLSGSHRLPEFRREKPWAERSFGDLFTERVETAREDLPLLSITAAEGVVSRDSLSKKDTSPADKSAYLRICPGDIGYNTMRMWQGVSGLSELEGLISPAYTVLIPGAEIDGRFASYLLKFKPVVHRLWRHSQGLVDDTLNLKFHHFSQVRAKVPTSVPEQRRIASILGSADAELRLLRQQHAALMSQKRGLMQLLLSGKKRVRV